MVRRRLLWQLFPSFLVILVLALLSVTWYASREVQSYYLQQTRNDLQSRALLLVGQYRPLLMEDNPRAIDSLCRALGAATNTRITVIDASGVVLGDSEEDRLVMDNHAARPEFHEALAGEPGTSVRFSQTLQVDHMYVAVPVKDVSRVVGAVRAATPIGQLNDILARVNTRIVLAGLIVALLAGLVSLWLSRKLTRPLVELRLGADRFARGELDHKLPIPNSEEIGALAEAMNHMAGELDDRIQTISRQRNEQEAVLASMVEGVLAVDTEERLINLNSAAAELLHLDVRDSLGLSIQEAVRNIELHRLIHQIFETHEAVEGEIVLRNSHERYLMAHGTLLRDSGGRHIGALIVLNDVTRLRQLEQVRREFVANVSHELKTPVTSIKGFVETLLDGDSSTEDRQRFLSIVLRQADRLNAIIDDLLNLSTIEQDVLSRKIEREDWPVSEVLSNAAQVCEMIARERGVHIEVSCPESLTAPLNAALLEQAVINLINNAIKFSSEGQTVTATAALDGRQVAINIIDRGRGIESEHIPRLFERFYRIDKARSREQGGTGLGLAIVKHIMRAHGGSVTVQSELKEGSVFTLHLPLDIH